MVMLFKEEAVLAILTYGTSRMMSNAHLPPLPIVLQTTEDLPLSIHLKGWMVKQIYMHYLAGLLAMRTSLPQMSSTESEKIIGGSTDSSDSS
jgi:hypothetical protein